MNAKRIAWAVMGLGIQGEKLIRAIEASEGSVIKALASRREFGSFERAIENPEVDAVAIVTPNDAHTEYAVAAVRAGKDVLCEKPLALSTHDVQKIAKSVQQSVRNFYVNYHLRMHADAQEVRRLVAENRLGKIMHIEISWSVGGLAKGDTPLPQHMQWREDPKQAGGGALVARGVHLLDLLRFISHQEIIEVIAWSDATDSRVDRTVVIVCTLEDGTPAVLTTSKVIPNADNRIVVYGADRKIDLRTIFSEDPQQMYESVITSFARAVAGEKTHLATLEDGAKAVRVTEAISKSIQTGKRVRVSY